MNKGRLYALLGGIFGLVGIILLVVTVWVVVSTVSFLSSAERLDGKVVELTEQTSSSSGSNRSSTAWYPTVEFTVAGETYWFQSSQGSNPPAYEVGDTVEVAYDPDDPNDARLASVGAAYFVPLITGGLGIVFTPIGVALFVKGRWILAQRAWLRRNGREIWAEIAHIGMEFNIRVNGRHPYVVHATWHDDQSGRTYTATSDYVRHDPGPGLRGQTHVRVLYDPADPDRNLLELGTRPT